MNVIQTMQSAARWRGWRCRAWRLCVALLGCWTIPLPGALGAGGVTASPAIAESPADESEEGPGPQRLKEVRISIATNTPPEVGGATNATAPVQKSVQWDFSWRGWNGLHWEVVEQTNLKQPLELLGLAPWSSNATPAIRLDRVKVSGIFGARVEVDGAAFVTTGDLTGFDDGAQLRRLRLFAKGDCILLFPVTYLIEVGYNANQFTLSKSYLLFRDIALIGDLKLGQFQPPMGLEAITSSRDITFMEPAAPIQAIAPGVDAGVQIGKPIFGQRATWAAGLFGRGAGSSEYGNTSEDFGAAIGRITWLPLYQVDPEKPSEDRFLHLGLSASILYSASSALQYRSRPESYIAPYVINTGNIPARSAATIGGEAAWVNGPFSVQGEILHSIVNQDDGSQVSVGGFYAFASYYLTGESRPYDRRTGAFKRLIPRHNFNFGRGGWGAFEIACRGSYTDLSDGPVQGGRMSLLMAGVNWHLHSHVRWMFNYGMGHVTGGASQGNMFIFQTRVGVDF